MKRFLLAITVLTCALISVKAQQLAFPGAEGYGAYATGGRGCQVVHVTNLNAAGTGREYFWRQRQPGLSHRSL